MAATNALPVADTNVGQRDAWDGDEGAYWAAHADQFERSARPFHERLVAAARIGAGERVLDVGCGTGQSTRLAARAASDGTVLGVDLSSPMLDEARRRTASEGITNATFEHADAQIHPFAVGAFDVAISNTGATFFGDLIAGFTNIRAALAPDGRVALVTWQSLDRNEWVREFTTALAAGRAMGGPPPGAPSPFALADPDRAREVLQRAGFARIEIEPLTEAMWFGDDADAAYEFVLGLLGWMVADLDNATRGRALDGLRATTTAHETAAGVVYESESWLVTAAV
jgi:SAM-dependent methyltransferase